VLRLWIANCSRVVRVATRFRHIGEDHSFFHSFSASNVHDSIFVHALILSEYLLPASLILSLILTLSSLAFSVTTLTNLTRKTR